MDGTPGLIAGVVGTAGGVVTAWINRGAAAGTKELRDALVGADGKAGPETIVGKLSARLTAVEQTVGTAAVLAGLPGEFTALRTWVDGQVKELAQRVARAERQRTGSQPALVDEHARHEIEELLRRVTAIEATLKEHAEGAAALQIESAKIMVKLDLLIGGNLQPGGRSR